MKEKYCKYNDQRICMAFEHELETNDCICLSCIQSRCGIHVAQLLNNIENIPMPIKEGYNVISDIKAIAYAVHELEIFVSEHFPEKVKEMRKRFETEAKTIMDMVKNGSFRAGTHEPL